MTGRRQLEFTFPPPKHEFYFDVIKLAHTHSRSVFFTVRESESAPEPVVVMYVQ